MTESYFDGTMQEAIQAGEVVVATVISGMPKRKTRAIPVFYAPNDHDMPVGDLQLVVMGVVIDDPLSSIDGYVGESRRVVWPEFVESVD